MKKIVLAIISLFVISTFCFSQQYNPPVPVKAKKEEPKKDSVMVITGDRAKFAILYALLVSPDDISANQKKFIIDWIEKGILILPKEMFYTTEGTLKKQN